VDDLGVLAAEVEDALVDAEHPVRRSRWWVTVLRVLVSLALVWVLVRKIVGVDFADLRPTWTPETIAWLVAALVLNTAAVVLAAARWKQVLVAMGMVSPPFTRLIRHYFAGQFVSNVLPSTIGGDVLRAARLSTDTGDAAESFASLIVERLTGWLVLPLLTLTGVALSSEVRASGTPATVALAIAGGTLVALVLILFAADHPRLGGRFAEREGWHRFLGAVHLGVAHLRRHPRAALAVVGVGIGYQLVLVLSAVAAARALEIDLDVVTMIALFPVILMVQVLPIGISGVGIREWALVFFLTPLGVPQESAVALGLLLFAVNLVVSLLGAPAFLAGGRRVTPVGGATS
jgi:uncharacterized membrane protein YbhN (UPF0104 family)